MATKKSKDAAEATPPYVFRGTVKKLGAATMKEVSAGERTAVVRVDQVIEAPKSFAHYEGQNITVELAGRAKYAVGDELIIHADSWMFGEGVAVRGVTQERVAKSHAAMLSKGGDPVQNRQARKLEDHLDEADLVVTGKVAAVTIPPEPAQPGLAARAARSAPPAAPATPVSEHDPKWRQAIIQIDETHKGSHDSREVAVMFPASTDVRWYRAPKFQAGQKALFVLHKTKVKDEDHHELRALSKAAGSADEVYTALHPEDVQPLTQQAAIKAMIR